MAYIRGNTSTLLAGVGVEPQSALHSTLKPLPYGTGGHYRIARRYALINSQAAGAILIAIRNSSSTLLAIPMRLRFFLHQISAPTAAIEVRISGTIARGYTTPDSTGGTQLTTGAANSVKKRTSMAVGTLEIRETNVAAGLTGGVRTLDNDSAFILALWELAAVPTAGPNPQVLYEWDGAASGEHPWVWGQNEGLIIRNDAVLGAAAAGVLYYEIDWAEVTAY